MNEYHKPYNDDDSEDFEIVHRLLVMQTVGRKAALDALIAVATGLDEGDFTHTSWSALYSALDTATNLAADADQNAVDAAAQTLKQTTARSRKQVWECKWMEYFFLLDKHLPEGVGIDMYGSEHIGWLASGAVICTLLCLGYLRLNEPGRRRMGITLAFGILFLEAFRIVAQIISGVFSVHYLPLHLCGLAVYFALIHAFCGGELLGEVLYGICMPSAICALAFPDWTRYPILNIQSIQSFLVHILLAAYPLMRAVGGDLRPQAKRLPKSLLFILSIAVPMYFLNKALGTNFLFLNWPSQGSPLELFAGALGNPGYILGYIPMLAAVWLLLYLPLELARPIRKRQDAKSPINA